MHTKESKDACLKHNYAVKINKFMRTSFEEFQLLNLDVKKQATKNRYYVTIEIPTHQQIKAIVNIFSLHWLNVKIIFVLFFDISISNLRERKREGFDKSKFLHAISSRPTKFDKNNQNKPSDTVQTILF